MGHMERVSVRDLRLKTSALLKNVVQGQTYVIESRGVPVADGEKFMQRMLNNLGQGKKRKVHGVKERRLQT
jgi:hypothetical protein